MPADTERSAGGLDDSWRSPDRQIVPDAPERTPGALVFVDTCAAPGAAPMPPDLTARFWGPCTVAADIG